MARFKTVKKEFASLPNEVIQGFYLSVEALGVLITCLSYPNDWQYRPTTLWKQLKIGRNRVYAAFDELVEKGHCIRIRHLNRNLRAEVDYIFFDEVKTCKEFIESNHEELNQKDIRVDHILNFKKILRHPECQNTEDRDTTRREVLKKLCIKKDLKKKDHLLPDMPPPTEFVAAAPENNSSLRSSEEEEVDIYKSLENTNLSPGQKRQLTREFTEPDIVRALQLSQGITITSSLMGLLKSILKDPSKYEKGPEPQNLTPQQQIALQYNAKLATIYPNTAKENEPLIAENKAVWIYIDIMRHAKTTVSLTSPYFEGDMKQAFEELKKVKIGFR